MKKALLCTGKILLFVLLWSGLMSLVFLVPQGEPLDIPEVLAAPLLRFYWEAIPLLLILLLTAVFIFLIEKRKVAIQMVSRPLGNTLAGLLTGAFLVSAVVGILIFSGVLSIVDKKSIALLPLWMAALFLNAVMQELFVRGYIFSLLQKNYNSLTAVLITTVIFTVIHLDVFKSGIVIVNMITLSILSSLVMLLFGSLWSSILVQYIWNLGCGMIINGISLGAYPYLYSVELTGNRLLAGGDLKMEASILVSAVNLVLIGVFLLLLKRKKEIDSRYSRPRASFYNK
jgi:membrane protease YdiL (CAAX protease family)